jgi:hypothetical protein
VLGPGPLTGTVLSKIPGAELLRQPRHRRRRRGRHVVRHESDPGQRAELDRDPQPVTGAAVRENYRNPDHCAGLRESDVLVRAME